MARTSDRALGSTTATSAPTSRRRPPPFSTRMSSAAPSSPLSPAPESATKALVQAAKHAEARVERALLRLLRWDELETWQRDNAYIQSGYRPATNSYRGSLASLARLHNESVNIWTHLVGALVFAAAGLFVYAVAAPRVESATAADLLVWACFFASACTCLGMSATFHTLSNHSDRVAKCTCATGFPAVPMSVRTRPV